MQQKKSHNRYSHGINYSSDIITFFLVPIIQKQGKLMRKSTMKKKYSTSLINNRHKQIGFDEKSKAKDKSALLTINPSSIRISK